MKIPTAFATSCAAALALVGPVFAQDDAADARAAFATELEDRVTALNEAMNEYYRPYREAKTDAEVAAIKLDPAANPAREFAPVFVDLMRRARGTETSVGAAQWALRLRRDAGPDAGANIKEIAGELLEHALATEALGDLIVGFVYDQEFGSRSFAALLDAAETRSPHASVRALTIYARGAAAMQKRSMLDKVDSKAARSFFDRVIAEYPTTPAATRARTQIFELDHLQVGGKPPDVEAVDQDGVKFKLSDYRGKVLVLDFWGFW